jgi:transposase
MGRRFFSLHMISALSPQGEFRFMLYGGSINAEVFHEFLKRLTIGAKLPLFLIVEKLVKEFAEAQNGLLKLFILPTYLPQLKPGERVWAHVKRQVSRQLVQSKRKMKRLGSRCAAPHPELPELVKSFFCQPWCQYASV